MNLRKALPLLVLAGLVLAGCASAPSTAEVKPQLTVSGTGLVRVSPDTASINLGVATQDSDVAQAVAASNLAAEAIINAVKNLGVAPEDVRTTYFNVSPQPMYDQSGQPTGQTNYWVNNTLVVTLRQVDQLGAVLQAAVDAGANSINGITFDLTDKSQAEEQARQAAIADARQRAERLATAAGATLDEIVSIYTGGYSYGAINYVEAASSAGSAGGGTVPIAPGTFDVRIDVTLAYTLK
jgi:uncharacterized protein YggE